MHAWQNGMPISQKGIVRREKNPAGLVKILILATTEQSELNKRF
jgi:hypothetical protein